MGINNNETEEFDDSLEETSDISDFTELVHCISDYYKGTNSEESDINDTWKKEAGLLDSKVPKKIDSLIKKAFITQLKKFIK